jgi:hypothetical protein
MPHLNLKRWRCEGLERRRKVAATIPPSIQNLWCFHNHNTLPLFTGRDGIEDVVYFHLNFVDLCVGIRVQVSLLRHAEV